MRHEVVHMCQVIVPCLDADVDETVEALALLVAVQGISTRSHIYPGRTPSGYIQLPSLQVILDVQEVSRYIKSPGSLHEGPSCLDLLGEVAELPSLSKVEEVVCKGDSASGFPIVVEEPYRCIALAHHVESVYHIDET